MKKVLIIGLILGFFCAGNALADEYIYGRCEINWMEIYESYPCFEGCGDLNRPASVQFTFYTPNDQVYELWGDAYGDQLVGAILKAGNWGENISCRLTYRFVQGFDITINWVDFNFPFDFVPVVDPL